MASDMVVALGKSTVDGRALFGHNSSRPAGEGQWLVRAAGRCFAGGEKVRTPHLELPQARQTCTVLGSQSRGVWGYHHGVNDHGVAIGCAALRTRLPGDRPGLLGTDLVRLGLERAATARQAVDLLTDLITRHGQGPYPGCPPEAGYDSALLIADATEAFAVEATGSHWVYQEIQQVRAMSDVCTVHQDWDWIAHGLAGQAIEQGWWPADGTKLDFAAALGAGPAGDESALRRWGRATLLLEEQNGHIDVAFIRRLLSDHYEGCPDEVDPLSQARGPAPICRHEAGAGATAASLVVQLGPLPIAWCAFGPPCASVHFPVILDGELPQAFGPDPASGGLWQWMQQLSAQVGADRDRWAWARSALAPFQARLDQEAEEFLAETAVYWGRGDRAEFERLAGLFMQHTVERFESGRDSLLRAPGRQPAADAEPEPAGTAAPWS